MYGQIEIPRMPSCVVTVFFDRRYGRFSYACTHSCRSWQVHPNGNIFPPPPSRAVQFRIKTWPSVEYPIGPQDGLFAGFQVVPAGQPFPSEATRWPPLPEEVTPDPPYPSPAPDKNDATWPLLTLEFGIKSKWAYRLAVLGADGRPLWDDPKIHDDGSDW